MYNIQRLNIAYYKKWYIYIWTHIDNLQGAHPKLFDNIFEIQEHRNI